MDPMIEPAGHRPNRPSGDQTSRPSVDPMIEPAGDQTSHPSGDQTSHPSGDQTSHPSDPTGGLAPHPTRCQRRSVRRRPAGHPAAPCARRQRPPCIAGSVRRSRSVGQTWNRSGRHRSAPWHARRRCRRFSCLARILTRPRSMTCSYAGASQQSRPRRVLARRNCDLSPPHPGLHCRSGAPRRSRPFSRRRRCPSRVPHGRRRPRCFPRGPRRPRCFPRGPRRPHYFPHDWLHRTPGPHYFPHGLRRLRRRRDPRRPHRDPRHPHPEIHPHPENHPRAAIRPRRLAHRLSRRPPMYLRQNRRAISRPPAKPPDSANSLHSASSTAPATTAQATTAKMR
jgi:hypothetical protein